MVQAMIVTLVNYAVKADLRELLSHKVPYLVACTLHGCIGHTTVIVRRKIYWSGLFFSGLT